MKIADFCKFGFCGFSALGVELEGRFRFEKELEEGNAFENGKKKEKGGECIF